MLRTKINSSLYARLLSTAAFYKLHDVFGPFCFVFSSPPHFALGKTLFPKLNLLTNHSRLFLDMQIIMPRVNNLRTVSACRERQWYSALKQG